MYFENYNKDYSFFTRFLVNTSPPPSQEEYWPLLLSLVVFPTAIQLMLLPWFPESPRYLLIEKGNIHATLAGYKVEPLEIFKFFLIFSPD